MLARWIATVAALLLACAQAGAHVRTERVADLVDRADVATPLGELAQQSKTALPARASMESTASGQNASVSHWRVGENGTESEESTSATALWRWDSAPFGETAANENPTVGLPSFTYNLRFPGQQYDRETGTHYNYFRDYEAQTGRYVQSDPVGVFGGLATFTYAHDSPTKYGDPFGLMPGGSCPCKKGALGVAKSVAKWTGKGCILLAQEVVIDAGGVTTRLDSVFLDPSTGGTFAVESKCGPCAGLTKNQKKAFPVIEAVGGSGRGPNAAAAGLSGSFGPMPVFVDRWL